MKTNDETVVIDLGFETDQWDLNRASDDRDLDCSFRSPFHFTLRNHGLIPR
jgi:hypothetical protein